jgi:hypothetical protein
MSRPHEHRTKLTVHVLPATAKRIAYLVDKKKREHSTLGRVVDAQFGVKARARVADARGGSAGERVSGKAELSRAKAQNNTPNNPCKE